MGLFIPAGLKLLTPKIIKAIIAYVFEKNELDTKIEELENRIKKIENK